MQLPTFDPTKAKWDAWRAFYINHSVGYHKLAFVQFDTGELICVQPCPRPEFRRRYDKLGVQIIDLSNDRYDYKFTTPDGERLKKAWLGGHYLIDHDTKRVVQLKYRTAKFTSPVPERFKDVSAYFPSAGMPPVGGEVHVRRPDPLTKAEKDRIEGLRAASKAWLAMTQDEYKNGYPDEEGKLIYSWTIPHPNVSQLLQVPDFASLSMRLRLGLVRKGVTGRTKTTTYPYILLA
jgi:hypothetical protein